MKIRLTQPQVELEAWAELGKRKDDEIEAIFIKIEKKEKETDEDNEDANKTDYTEETLQSMKTKN